MSDLRAMADEVRAKILARPEVILDDPDVMRALVAANDASLGGNVIDLRRVAMDRLEERLGRLEATHQGVLAAAYDNLAGMAQVHRAALRLLEPRDLGGFLADLDGPVAEILRVDRVRLVLECEAGEALPARSDVLIEAVPGTVSTYVTLGRGGPARAVTLRRAADGIWTDEGIGSEACLVLDLGARLPGLLLLGAADPHRFGPSQGTDLLAFLAGVAERALGRWLG